MYDVETWHDALGVDSWPPTAPVKVVMRIYEDYDKLPTPAP
jgi:hypothetical protein